MFHYIHPLTIVTTRFLEEILLPSDSKEGGSLSNDDSVVTNNNNIIILLFILISYPLGYCYLLRQSIIDFLSLDFSPSSNNAITDTTIIKFALSILVILFANGLYAIVLSFSPVWVLEIAYTVSLLVVIVVSTTTTNCSANNEEGVGKISSRGNYYYFVTAGYLMLLIGSFLLFNTLKNTSTNEVDVDIIYYFNLTKTKMMIIVWMILVAFIIGGTFFTIWHEQLFPISSNTTTTTPPSTHNNDSIHSAVKEEKINTYSDSESSEIEDTSPDYHLSNLLMTIANTLELEPPLDSSDDDDTNDGSDDDDDDDDIEIVKDSSKNYETTTTAKPNFLLLLSCQIFYPLILGLVEAALVISILYFGNNIIMIPIGLLLAYGMILFLFLVYSRYIIMEAFPIEFTTFTLVVIISGTITNVTITTTIWLSLLCVVTGITLIAYAGARTKQVSK
mmetsp:Transcript_7256/g.8277  ORF Transcript_7256/g.8277 Transcript_7256/m.8277 type:complete len:447 (+) Transcript_7256:129-1469(+)